MMRRLPSLVVAIALALSMTAAQRTFADDKADVHPDFSGTWRLDPDKSDMPRRPEGGWGGGGSGRHGFGGGFGGGGGRGGFGRRHGGGEEAAPVNSPEQPGNEATQGGPRAHFGMPRILKLTQTSEEIELADSVGNEVREVALVAGPYDSTKIAGKIPRDPGRWDKDKLTVERVGPGELKTREEFALDDKGQTLVIKTHMEGGRGSGEAREFKRVYRKVGA